MAEPQTTTAAWCVYTPPGSTAFFHYLPKSEYVPCDPPQQEEWKNVTSRCEIDSVGYITVDGLPSIGVPTRFRKLDRCDGPCFIVERRRS